MTTSKSVTQNVTASVKFDWIADRFNVVLVDSPSDVPEWDVTRHDNYLPSWIKNESDWIEYKERMKLAGQPLKLKDAVKRECDNLEYPRFVRTFPKSYDYGSYLMSAAVDLDKLLPSVRALYPLLLKKDSQRIDSEFARKVDYIANLYTPYGMVLRSDYRGLTLRSWAVMTSRTYLCLKLGSMLATESLKDIQLFVKESLDACYDKEYYVILGKGKRVKNQIPKAWPPLPWHQIDHFVQRANSKKEIRQEVKNYLMSMFGGDACISLTSFEGTYQLCINGGVSQWISFQALSKLEADSFRVCDGCGQPFILSRKDSKTCNATCRKRKQRKIYTKS